MSRKACVYLLIIAASWSLFDASAGDTSPQGTVGSTRPWANGRLRVTRNGRFLAHENGERFDFLADTAWGLIAKLDRAEVDLYMQNTAAKGFTAVLSVALWDNSRRVNGHGDHPLGRASTGKYDPKQILTTPGNDPAVAAEYDFWDHLDYIISKAEENGLYVALLPTWGHFVCCTTTYATNMNSIIFDADTARSYGRFLGQRYASRPNIIWVNGGDRAAVYGTWDFRPVWRALAEGIGSGVTGQTLRWDTPSPGWDKLLMTFHPMRRVHGSSLWFHNEPWLDFNGVEAEYKDIVKKIAIDWNKVSAKPTSMLEGRYEGTPALDGKEFEGAYGQRFQQYHTVFSGAAGFAYGHSRIWNVLDDGRDKPWYVAMDDAGRSQMRNLLVLLGGLTDAQWLDREPDQTLIDGPVGTLPDEDYIAAMRGRAGDFALVYSTNGRDIRLNLDKLRAGVADAYWFNPRTAVLSSAFAAVRTGPGAGIRTFDPPGSAGYNNDWTLKLVVRSTAAAGSTTTCPIVEDTAIKPGLTGVGRGGTLPTAGSATAPTHTLWRFSLACVPAGKKIVKASVKWMVYQDSGRSVNQFDLYELRRAWVEGSATWTHWAGMSAWARPGAEDSTADRGGTVLGSIAARSADVASGAWVSAALNGSGLQTLQNWRTGARPNNGFLLKAAGGSDTLRVRSSETGSSASRPKLEITYEP